MRQLCAYQYDNLSPDDYVITVRTIFDDVQTISFFLDKDTIIHVHDVPGFTIVDSISPNALLHADTIAIALTSDGCFHHYKVNHFFIRKGNVFVSRTSIAKDSLQHRREIPQEELACELIAMQRDVGSSLTYVEASTTRFGFYLKAGNTVYRRDHLSNQEVGKFYNYLQKF